jgi:hypothetical protein
MHEVLNIITYLVENEVLQRLQTRMNILLYALIHARQGLVDSS